jgi:hypothetical protein
MMYAINMASIGKICTYQVSISSGIQVILRLCVSEILEAEMLVRITCYEVRR